MTIGRLRILAPENLTPFSTAGHASTHELPLSDSHRTPQPPTMPETPNMTPLFVLRFLKTSLAVPGRKSVRRRIRSGLKIEGLEARIALAISASNPYEIAYVGDVGADGTGPTDAYLADGANPITRLVMKQQLTHPRRRRAWSETRPIKRMQTSHG